MLFSSWLNLNGRVWVVGVNSWDAKIGHSLDAFPESHGIASEPSMALEVQDSGPPDTFVFASRKEDSRRGLGCHLLSAKRITRLPWRCTAFMSWLLSQRCALFPWSAICSTVPCRVRNRLWMSWVHRQRQVKGSGNQYVGLHLWEVFSLTDTLN